MEIAAVRLACGSRTCAERPCRRGGKNRRGKNHAGETRRCHEGAATRSLESRQRQKHRLPVRIDPHPAGGFSLAYRSGRPRDGRRGRLRIRGRPRLFRSRISLLPGQFRLPATRADAAQAAFSGGAGAIFRAHTQHAFRSEQDRLPAPRTCGSSARQSVRSHSVSRPAWPWCRFLGRRLRQKPRPRNCAIWKVCKPNSTFSQHWAEAKGPRCSRKN